MSLGLNVVDWVLLAAVVVFAVTGWRQGFVAGLLSFVGFLVGGVGGAFLIPMLVERTSLDGVARALLVAAGVLVCAVLGQAIAGVLGRRLSEGITWHPARLVDSIAGAALNVLALAIVAWIVASAVAVLPDTTLSRQIRQSQVLVGLDRLVPDAARNLFIELRDLVATSGVPRVFAGIGQIIGPEVPPPDPAIVKLPAVRATWPSLVKVSGAAPDCGTQLTGSGFVYAPERVMTNAHVVAGVSAPVVQVAGDPQAYQAEVVYFDSRLDVAVLATPGLDAEPIPFAQESAGRGDQAVVAGFPGGGKLTATAARIRIQIQANGEDIYGRAGVVRDVYAFTGKVRPGNSGGPLLSPDGTVYGVVFAAGLDDASSGYALTGGQVAQAARVGASATTPVLSGSCHTR